MTQYVLLKRDLFECPKHMGYTGIRDKAGVYSAADIEAYEVPIRQEYDHRERDLYAVPIAAAPEFTHACFADLARDHLCGKIEKLRKENEQAFEKLLMLEQQRNDARETAAKMQAAFDVLNRNVGYELTWGEVDGWPDNCGWRVHRRNGGRSDTQWTFVAAGSSAQDALLSARAYIASEPT